MVVCVFDFLIVLLVWALVGLGCIWGFFEMLKEKTPQPHTGFAGYRTIPCSPCSHPPSFTLLHTLSYRATNMIPMMCCRICNYSSTDTTSQTTLINVRLHRANCRSALHMLLIPLKGPCVNGFMSRGHCTLLTC